MFHFDIPQKHKQNPLVFPDVTEINTDLKWVIYWSRCENISMLQRAARLSTAHVQI